MRKQWIILLIAVMASMTLWGCGSSGSGGSEVTAPEEVLNAANAGNCTVCHTFQVHVDIDGVAGVNNDADGLGSIITHDCEACHGGGQFHHGEGPMPYPDPNGERCAECHEQATKFLSSAHNLLDEENVEMLADGHDTSYCQRCHTAEGSRAFIDVIGEKSDIEAAIVAYGEDVVAPARYEALQNEDTDGNATLHVATCGACHNPLTKELVTADLPVSWDPNQNGEADQLDLCTSCHNYKTEDGMALFGSGSTDNPTGAATAEFYHDTAWYRTITSTHYDFPETADRIEGYVIRETSENPCFDCHGHELKTNTRRANDLTGDDESRTPTPHNGWARSAHAGGLLNNVFAAVDLIDCTGSPSESHGRCDEQADAAMSAYVDDTTGPAWNHYNWDDTSTRGDCQECHTATGAMNYLNDPDNYDYTNNDFSHLDSWDATGGSPQNEMLYCWACHTDVEDGSLRNPGATTRPYTVGGVNVTMPDLASSNICINCHGARGNVEGYAFTADPAVDGDVNDPATDMSALQPGFGPGTKNVTNAHYLVASATLYAADSKIGYEYLGQSYAPVPYFEHGMIGLDTENPETSAGPCVACHMETGDSHTFEVVEKDDMGVIIALNSTSCVECHTGGHGAGLVVEDTTTENGLQTAAAAAAFLEEEAEGYHEALEMLREALDIKNLEFSSNYPYFSGDSWIDEGTFGAAHNYNYLHHEPGAYAHNRYYAKRLIFDSLDWLDNGTLDGMITIDAVTYPEADAWLASGAARP